MRHSVILCHIHGRNRAPILALGAPRRGSGAVGCWVRGTDPLRPTCPRGHPLKTTRLFISATRFQALHLRSDDRSSRDQLLQLLLQAHLQQSRSKQDIQTLRAHCSSHRCVHITRTLCCSQSDLSGDSTAGARFPRGGTERPPRPSQKRDQKTQTKREQRGLAAVQKCCERESASFKTLYPRLEHLLKGLATRHLLLDQLDPCCLGPKACIQEGRGKACRRGVASNSLSLDSSRSLSTTLLPVFCELTASLHDSHSKLNHCLPVRYKLKTRSSSHGSDVSVLLWVGHPSFQ